MINISRYKKENLESYALGVAPVLDLLTFRPHDIITIYIHPSLSLELQEKITTLAQRANVSVSQSIKPFNTLSQKENCFAIGVFKKYSQTLEKKQNHVVLVNPSNTGNLGTIMRSCLGFGIKNIAIIQPGVDAFDPKCIRASMGAFFQINVQYFDSFPTYQKQFSAHRLYPFMLKAQTLLQNLDSPQEPYALIFGNEGSGLPDSFLSIGTPLLILHTHDIDSLNIQTAVSLACYEFTRKAFSDAKNVK